MSITYIKIITVVLKLRRKSVAVVLSMVESVIKKMTDNPNFVSIEPPLSQIEEEKEELKNAFAIARDGSKAQKATVKVKLRKLMLSMTTLKSYVQTIANADVENGEEVALSSGMYLKGFTPRPKRKFSVKNTNLSGTVKVICPRTKGDIMFQCQYTTTPDNEASYIETDITPAATRTISGLVRGKRYYFRWASITSTGRSAWSDTIHSVIM